MDNYLSKAWDACIPVYTTLELSLRCNLRCVHCYNFDRSIPYQKAKRTDELTLVEIKKLIEDLASTGTFYLSLTGGEPLLHPDIFEIIRHARDNRLAVRLKTNAILITEEIAKKLSDLRIDGLDISVYGATPETHDRFTVQPGSFQKTWNGIRNAKKYGLMPKLSFVLHAGCANEFAEMMEMANQEGVSFSASLELTRRYDGSTSSRDHRLSKEDLRKLYTAPNTKHYFEEMQTPKAQDSGVQCSCARTVCGIASNGDVYPCIGAPVFSGNIREKKFQEIWKNAPELNRIRNLTLPDFKDCVSCADRTYCMRSSGAVYSDTGNYTGSEEWTCMNAKLVHELSIENGKSV